MLIIESYCSPGPTLSLWHGLSPSASSYRHYCQLTVDDPEAGERGWVTCPRPLSSVGLGSKPGVPDSKAQVFHLHTILPTGHKKKLTVQRCALFCFHMNLVNGRAGRPVCVCVLCVVCVCLPWVLKVGHLISSFHIHCCHLEAPCRLSVTTYFTWIKWSRNIIYPYIL